MFHTHTHARTHTHTCVFTALICSGASLRPLNRWVPRTHARRGGCDASLLYRWTGIHHSGCSATSHHRGSPFRHLCWGMMPSRTVGYCAVSSKRARTIDLLLLRQHSCAIFASERLRSDCGGRRSVDMWMLPIQIPALHRLACIHLSLFLCVCSETRAKTEPKAVFGGWLLLLEIKGDVMWANGQSFLSFPDKLEGSSTQRSSPTCPSSSAFSQSL